jgi:DNA-binding CsgD family transcriptional regulator
VTARSDLPPPFRSAAPQSGWRRRGAELARRAELLRQRGAELLGDAPAEPAGLTWAGIERLRDDPPTAALSHLIADLVCDAQDLDLEMHEHEMASRARRIASCESGLARLRAISRSGDLIDRACGELVHSCNFDRAVLGRVEDGAWTPWVHHFEHVEEMEQWLEDWMDNSIPLGDMMLETELVQETRPELVTDTTGERIHPIIREGLSHSYVVAPVMPAGNVVGFLHADHGISGRTCDEADRDILWAFAEGFGHIYERTVLLERLHSQRDEVRSVLTSVESAMAALNDAGLELAAQPDAQSAVTRTAVSVLTTMSGSFEELTPRELEVLEMMVSGARNQKIAEQLVITVGTVKSHVKHILRKLGAVNRSQAIAQYLGVIGGDAD